MKLGIDVHPRLCVEILRDVTHLAIDPRELDPLFFAGVDGSKRSGVRFDGFAKFKKLMINLFGRFHALHPLQQLRVEHIPLRTIFYARADFRAGFQQTFRREQFQRFA